MKPTFRKRVIVTRRWDSPSIEVFVHAEAVGASMDLDAFTNAVLDIIGSPALILTRAQLRGKITNAMADVATEMKDKTRYVV